MHISSKKMGRVHRSLVGSLNPIKITFPLQMTSHFLSSKFTWHPALHNTQMPRSDAIIILGTMCPMSVNGKPGMVTSHMRVDVTFFPLGREIVIGLMAIRLFLQFVPSMTKREVAPVSATVCVGLIIMALA